MKFYEIELPQREVKFRCWDKKEKSMIPCATVDMDWYRIRTIDKNRYVLCQYTGLKDKNGKEIYEGNIIKNNGSLIYIVYWHKFAGAWDTKPIEKERCFTTTKPLFEQVEKWECEVIGNIFENSYLLNK